MPGELSATRVSKTQESSEMALPWFLNDWFKRKLQNSPWLAPLRHELIPAAEKSLILRSVLISRDRSLYLRLKAVLSQVAGVHCSLEWAATQTASLEFLAAGETDLIIYDLRSRRSCSIPLLNSHTALLGKKPLLYICDSKSTAKAKKHLNNPTVDYIEDSEITPSLLERIIRYILNSSSALSTTEHPPHPLAFFEQLRNSSARNQLTQVVLSIFNAIPYPFFCKDHNLTYIGCNQRFAQLLGVLQSSVAGKKNIDLPWQNTEIIKQLDALEKRAIISGSPQSCTLELEVPSKGTRIWMQADLVPLFENRNESLVLVGSFTDISSHKRVQAALRSTELQLRKMLEQLPALVWTIDRDLHIYPCSLSSQVEFSQGRADAKSKLSVYDLFQGDGPREAPAIMAKRALRGESLSFQLSHQGRMYQIRMEPMKEADGTIVGAIGVATEFTTQSFNTGTAGVKQKSESLRQLAGGIAQDFRKTMLNILGEMSLLASSLPENSTAARRLEKINGAVDQASTLTKQLLIYSGKTSALRTRLRINVIAKEVEENIACNPPLSVAFIYQLAEDLPPISGDPKQIRHALINLITNAIEAIVPREGKIRVRSGIMELRSSDCRNNISGIELHTGNYLFLEVSDTGKGFSEAVHHKIFDPYFTTKLCNRGLGLATVLGIMREHQGGIFVHSKKNRGSIFRLVFPVS